VRVLVTASIGGAGHLGPVLPFADAAARRGDDVLVVVPPSLEALAAASGHAVAVGAAPPPAETARIRDLIAGAGGPTAGTVDTEVFGRLATAAMLPAMADIAGRFAPDLVVREPCEYAAAIVAERAGIPYGTVGISVASIEASVNPLVAPILERHLAGVGARLMTRPFLTRFPASLDPSAFADTRRYAEVRPAPAALPDWWPGRAGPLVYVTLGSVTGTMAIAGDAYRAVTAAVAGLPARVLLTVGPATDVAAVGPVPDHVHVEAWVPQADVVAHADLVVSHGGSGTTFGALASGVPVVVVPLFADQFTNGDRVEDAGAGVSVGPVGGRPRSGFTPDDVARIAAAVRHVLATPGYRRAARAVAAEMARLPTVDAVLDTLLAVP
jgi:UDP:flavonoid glycosyltransferase YjiC (YdhE family)